MEDDSKPNLTSLKVCSNFVFYLPETVLLFFFRYSSVCKCEYYELSFCKMKLILMSS